MSTSAADLVREDNPLTDAAAYHAERAESEVAVTLRDLADQGGRITRLRLLTEVWPGRGRLADVSYIHGRLADGTPVRVIDPAGHLDSFGMPMRAGGVQRRLVEWAKAEGVYAKGVGLLDQGNWSILY